jgi:hypothetical protein
VAAARRVCTPALCLGSAFLLAYSACVMPFGEISTDLYASVYGYDDRHAARTTSVTTIVGIVAMGPLGLLLDLKRWYHGVALAGILLFLPPFVMLAVAAPVPPEVMAALVGLSGAAVGAVVWPMLSLRISWEVQGRVLGALTAAQNGILVISPLVVGVLRDRVSTPAPPAALTAAPGSKVGDAAGATNPAAAASFASAMWFLVALAVVCVGLVVWIAVHDGWSMPRQVHWPAPETEGRSGGKQGGAAPSAAATGAAGGSATQ